MRIPRQASGQHGAFTAAQADAAGIDDLALTRAVRAGRLVRLHRGVYAEPSRAAEPTCRLAAVLLCAGPAAVLSHRTAAQLLALPIDARPGPTHLSVPRTAHPSTRLSAAVIVHRTRFLTQADTFRVRGLRCTRIARTVLDMCAQLPPDASLAAVAKCLQDRRTSATELTAAAERAPRAAGRRALLQILADLQPGHQSVAEVHFARALAATALPPALFNPRLDTGHGAFHPDAYWPHARVAVEVAGQAFHLSPASWEADIARQAALTAAGIVVLTITWRQLTDPQRQASFFDQLAQVLTDRAINSPG